MTAAIPTVEPDRIVAGDTVRWTRSLGDYLASAGWVLTYELANAAYRYTFAAAADGDDHAVTVAAATTATWVAGEYAWRARVAKAGEVYTVAEGRMVVAVGYGAAVDTRSDARRQLEAVEAVLQGRASDGVADYAIMGRSVRRIPIPELLALRDRLRIDVAREDAAQRAAAGIAPRGRVQVRFG